MVHKVALWQISFQYFGLSCQFLFHPMLHTHLSSGAGTIGPLVADVPSGLSLIPPQEIYIYESNSTNFPYYSFFINGPTNSHFPFM
jgi:hypothetical protein